VVVIVGPGGVGKTSLAARRGGHLVGASRLADHSAVEVDLSRSGAQPVAFRPPLGYQRDAGRHEFETGERKRGELVAVAYLNKRHWNTVALDGSVPDEELLELIDHSYELVVARLSRAERKGLAT
jgi:hypothetical protein